MYRISFTTKSDDPFLDLALCGIESIQKSDYIFGLLAINPFILFVVGCRTIS